MKRRTTFHLVATVLENATDGISKTHAQNSAGYNLRMWKRDLPLMLKNDLLKELKDGRLKTTSKGHEFVTRFRALDSMYAD